MEERNKFLNNNLIISLYKVSLLFIIFFGSTSGSFVALLLIAFPDGDWMLADFFFTKIVVKNHKKRSSIDDCRLRPIRFLYRVFVSLVYFRPHFGAILLQSWTKTTVLRSWRLCRVVVSDLSLIRSRYSRLYPVYLLESHVFDWCWSTVSGDRLANQKTLLSCRKFHAERSADNVVAIGLQWPKRTTVRD